MRVLVLNLKMDAADTALGFTSSWVNAIARRCEHVTVITMEAGQVELEPNVRLLSMGKEKGWSEARRAAAFYRHLIATLRGGRVDVCFAHMATLFTLMAAPFTWRRVPVVLWYAHGAVPLTLRLAERVATMCLTSTPQGFRMPSGKLRVLHQGIDTTVFVPGHEPNEATIVSVGRTSPVKHLIEMVEAVAAFRDEHRTDLRLILAGGPIAPRDHAYEDQLRARIDELGLSSQVDLLGPVPFHAVVPIYQRAGIFLNLSASGSLDKAILEAMACGCIPVSRNDAFKAAVADRHDLGALVPDHGDHGGVGALRRVLGMSPGNRHELRGRLRRIVEAEHSLEALADKIVAALEEATRARP